MISFKNVKLNINNKTIIKNFNVDIKQYSKSVFLGEKKSGKTTFFKILTGCYKPTNGNIYIDGTEMTGITEVFAEVGSGFLSIVIIIYSFLLVGAIWGIYGITILIILIIKRIKNKKTNKVDKY